MNIVMIMSDSLYPQSLGSYGDGCAVTPHLDRLAAQGVQFGNVYSNCPLCTPSRASMVTGRYASELRCYDNASAFSSEWPTVAHVLAAPGYETSIIGKMHFVGHDQWHGFDERLALETDYTTGHDPAKFRMAYQWDSPSQGNPMGSHWMGDSYVQSPEWDYYPHHYDRDQITHSQALHYLNNKGPGCEPFFTCISYHAPHNPFWIPEPYKEPFRDRPLPLPDIPDIAYGVMEKWVNDFHYVPENQDKLFTAENLRWLYETYYGMVYYLDCLVGDILACLERRGLRDNTMIVFTSDHGEMLAHRGMIQKRCFFERSVRVPLIIHHPGQSASGTVVEELASLVDIFPTLADAGGFPLADLPPGLRGQSLLPAVLGLGPMAERPVFSEYHGEGVHAPCFMVRDGSLKYMMVHGQDAQLYDLAKDPDELHNVSGQAPYQDAEKQLQQRLLQEFDPELVAQEALETQENRGFILRCHQRREAQQREASTS